MDAETKAWVDATEEWARNVTKRLDNSHVWQVQRDAELAELRDEVHALARAVSSLQEECLRPRDAASAYDRDLHSVKVPDHASTPVERGRYTE